MKQKILLIDDSVTIHRVIDLCIDKDVYDVSKVFSKDDALIHMKSDGADVILLDNKLADTKASEMVSLIKEHTPESKIIMLAGAFDQFDEEQCGEIGADDFIFKPFDAEAINEKITKAIAPLVEDIPDMTEVDEPEIEIEEAQPIEEDTSIPLVEDTSDMTEVDEPEIEIEEAQPIEENTSLNVEETSDELGDLLNDISGDSHEPKEQEEDNLLVGSVAMDTAEPPVEDIPDITEVDEPEIEIDELDQEIEEEASLPNSSTIGDLEEMKDVIDSLTNDETPNEEEQVAPETNETMDKLDELLIQSTSEEDPFEGLVEFDESAQPEEEREEPEAEEGTSEEVDKFDQLLDNINGDVDESGEMSVEDFEEVIEEASTFLEGANANLIDDTPDTPEIDEPEIEIDETQPIENSTSAPELEDIPDVAETVETTESEEEASLPSAQQCAISVEELTEVVYNAIDDDVLKFAIKEVLTDKITAILEEELPILVERAIRKEIERLVKGS